MTWFVALLGMLSSFALTRGGSASPEAARTEEPDGGGGTALDLDVIDTVDEAPEKDAEETPLVEPQNLDSRDRPETEMAPEDSRDEVTEDDAEPTPDDIFVPELMPEPESDNPFVDGIFDDWMNETPNQEVPQDDVVSDSGSPTPDNSEEPTDEDQEDVPEVPAIDQDPPEAPVVDQDPPEAPAVEPEPPTVSDQEPPTALPSVPPTTPPTNSDSERGSSEEILAQADYFVAVTGSDNAAGTIDDPFASIERAVELASPGDVILVRGGVYEGTVNVSKGGEEGAPVKIMAYPDERPVIDGSGTQPDTDLVVISDSHVHFEGFEVMGATRTGISVWSTDNVTIADNVIHDAIRGGIWVGAENLEDSYGHLIEGNDVFNTSLENEAKVWDEGWPRAIAIDVSSDTIVRDNMVFKNYGEGFGALSSTDVQFIDNIGYDNYSVQMYFDNSQDITATGNILFHTGDEEFFRDGEPGIGILVANEETQYELATTGLLVQDNTFAGVEPVYYDGSYGWGGGITDSVIGPNEVLAADEVDSDWVSSDPFFF